MTPFIFGFMTMWLHAFVAAIVRIYYKPVKNKCYGKEEGILS